IAGIEQADALLLVGTNPRWEAALVNARIRKRWIRGQFPIGLIGQAVDLTYDYEHLGAGAQTLSEVADGTHRFAEVLKAAKKPMVVVGMGALGRGDGPAVLAAVRSIAETYGMVQPATTDEDGDTVAGWNGFNVLHTAAAR